jgi:hypothetical protein
MADPLGLKLQADPLLHFAERQDTLFWRIAEVPDQARASRADAGGRR